MQVSNISRKNSYFPHFAPRKQISCKVNEPKQCISTWQTAWQTTEMSTLTVENKIGSFKTKANRHWKEVACQADVRGEERVTSLRTSAWEATCLGAHLGSLNKTLVACTHNLAPQMTLHPLGSWAMSSVAFCLLFYSSSNLISRSHSVWCLAMRDLGSRLL